MDQAQNKMGVMPVKRLLIHMSWPVMLSMFIQALYNLVDSVFVAQLNGEAFLALGFAFPVQTFIVAICVGTGVGVNALLSRRLGEKRAGEANAVAMNGYFVYFVVWLVFLVFGLFFGRVFMTFFTTDPKVLVYGGQYLTIVTTCSIGMCMQFAAERVLQATGNPLGNMVVQGIGAVINLILDPIFIFTLHMGVAGAAIATVIGQLVGMLAGFYMVYRSKELQVQLRGFRPDWGIIKDIYRIGLPAIVMQSLVTFMTVGMNKLLGLYDDTLVFVLSAYFKLQSFVFMPVFGLNNGMIPIISYNYGAHNRKRISQTIHFSFAIGVGIMVLGTLLFWCLPDLLLRCFTSVEQTIAVGVPAMRMVSLSFVFAGVSIICSAAFQALAAPMLSLVVSLLRQLVIVLPAAFFICLWNPYLVWLAFPAAEIISCLFALIFYRSVYQERIAALVEQ